MKTTISLFVLPAVMCTSVLLGCSSGPPVQGSIVGTWSWDQKHAGDDVGYRYSADGTYDHWYKSARVNTSGKGSYKLDGSRLALAAPGSTADGNSLGAATVESIRWVSADKFELTDAPDSTGATAINSYTRVK